MCVWLRGVSAGQHGFSGSSHSDGGMTGRGAGHPGCCQLCGARLKRNGTTSAGRTRWRCTGCGASSTKSRPDRTRRAELAAFVRWLLGPLPQLDAAPASARTFRRHSAWCWQVEPAVTVTGEIYDEVQLDGIYLSSHWCALIASHRGKVLAWQWCDREKTIAWRVLLQRLPPPQVVVCDGGPGLHAALNQDWPDTRVQRCLVHVQRNVRTQLTSRPRTDAGKALWGLAKTLTRIGSLDEATAWLGHLNDWHTLHGHLIKARTYRDQLRGAAVPAWVRPGQLWWYTHDRLRRAYRLLERLARDEHLFTYLDPDFTGLSISSTTNSIEGGVNAGLRDLLRRHRGIPEHHQRRAIEWWLHAHAEAPVRPSIHPPASTKPTRRPLPDEPDGPARYDTAVTAEEGLWHRRGWAGRS